jgi:RNA polymerase sigma-70 factor, ECF subfamily
MTDSDLIQRLTLRDETAFKELIEKYQKLVYNACFHLLHHPLDAEDVAQEVFIEVFESIHQFRNESKLSTWLYRISVNKSLNYLRKNRLKSLFSSMENFFSGDRNNNLEIEDRSDTDSPLSIDYKERNIVLQKAIDGLPENQRLAFSMHKFDELSYQEICEIMNLSLSSVESLIHRAKMNLQKKLINYYKN